MASGWAVTMNDGGSRWALVWKEFSGGEKDNCWARKGRAGF